MERTVAIIGTGQAGLQTAVSLRELRYPGRIVLIGDEPHAPYQRPPLSKGYLLGQVDEENVVLRPRSFFPQHRIELITGRRAVSIDRTRQRICLDAGAAIEYEHLVIATGARNRPLAAPGADLRNAFYLRSLDEAAALKAQMATAKSAVVIGAGFVGMEFAASAAKRGLDVTVLDIASRPMARAVSDAVSSVLVRELERTGVRFLFGTQVQRFLGDNGVVSAVSTSDGRTLAADLVMVGIGAVPNTELAETCGLAVDAGIVVDESLRTKDPNISAIGDVARHPNRYGDGHHLRLESVQNALDQARCVAQRLAGRPSAYAAVPWFWSDQGSIKLQIAGLPRNGCEEVVRGDPSAAACAVFSFYEGKLVCVETLNRPADHMLARRLLSTQAGITAHQAADSGFDLKSLLPRPPSK